MIKWLIDSFKSAKKAELVITPSPVSSGDNFVIQVNKALKNLLNFIKDTYEFDKVDYYSFEKPFTSYDHHYRKKLSEAFYDIFGSDEVELKLENLNSFRFIICERSYDNTSKLFYIPIYHFYDPDGNWRILLDEALPNNLGFLRIPLINLSGGIDKKARRFLEYREIYDDDQSEIPVFMTLDNVFSNVIPVKKTPPLLDIYDYPYYEAEYPHYENREADFIVKRYFNQYGVEFCLFELRYGKKIIKTKTIKIDSLVFDMNKEVDEFLFPLLEKPEMLADFNLTPEFSSAFMSQDFSDFIAIKNMTTI